jgi:SAM-dependent methyltransferase
VAYEDHFSRLANAYAQYRPQYPAELYAYLAGLTPSNELAWDCGTGSGQAALGLAEHYRRVWATDASASQLAHARKHPRVCYQISHAGQSALPGRSVDLVTAAEALHWFELDSFYAEVRRVLNPGGVLAAWCYHLPEIDPRVDALLSFYYREVVGPYWSPGIRLVEERYQTIPFPFDEVEPPHFEMRASWDLDTLLGFLYSWSANQKYIEAHGSHPVEQVQGELERAWGEASQRKPVRWRLYFRIGVLQARAIPGNTWTFRPDPMTCLSEK